MSKIQITEPLFVSRAQSEAISTPLQDDAAAGAASLDSDQQAVVLGEPIPIVFCRRVDSIGGALASPKATEAGYSNNAVTNALTVNLELVLSEGQLPLVQIRDVFQRACRVGTWAQAYDARAGTWNPGNTVTVVAGKTPWNCPYYCGTSGSYDNMTTLSYTNTHADGDETWSKQVHVFVRNGMQVTRIIDSVVGSSNNVVDLVLYLITQTNRVPSTLIDSAAMLTAAQFTNTNGLLFNGIVQTSTNLEEWLYNTSAGFLLRFCDRAGKKILKPRLPINNDYTIKTTAITAEYKFTENDLLPDGFEIDYVSLEQRLPACIVVLWRQQPDDDIGIIRTTEVRFTGEALTGPYEQYDLSEYCASENHAVKVGTYYAARRKYITHSLRIQVRPGAFNSTLELGDIVRVQLARETDVTDYAIHDYYYEVDRISKATSGVVTLDLTHFPIDEQNRSLVALKVAEAVGAGYTMATGRADFSCDITGRRTDSSSIANTPDPDPPILPDPDNFEYTVPTPTITSDTSPITFGPDGATIPGGRNAVLGLIGASSPVGDTENPADPIEEEETPPDITGETGDDGHPVDGDTLLTSPTCPNGKVSWYKRPKDGGERQLLKEETISGSGNSDLSITTDEIDHYIEADTRCPDPSSPDGYGSPVTQTTGLVEANYNFYNYVRWVGTIFGPFSTESKTSPWLALTGNDAATIGPLWGCVGNTPSAVSDSSTCPPVGPINWRSGVITVNKITNPTGFYGLGGLSFYDKFAATNTSACSNAYAVQWTGTVEGRVISIEGKWEFSVDGSTVAAEWEGRTDQSEGE
jgi:hypothetical protein